MKLTTAERWILANQYRLMQMLSDRPVSLYEHAITILENGYEDQYEYAAQYLKEDPFPQDVAEEVKDILQMFSEMQWAAEDIEDPSIRESPLFEFWGFDGNNSFAHHSYARFLHEIGGYPDLKKRATWNSHSDNIATYRAMVRVWKALPRHGLLMTEEDLKAILEAPKVAGSDPE